MTTDELNAIVQAVMLEMEKAGVDFDFKAETPQPTDLVYVMRGTSDKYQGITVKWQNLLDIIVKKATDAKDEAVSAKDIALQTLATIQGIESNVSTMKTNVETAKSQVETMKASVEASEANVTQMKSDVSTMKASVEGTKTEVENIKEETAGLLNTKADKTYVDGELAKKVNYTDALTYEEIMATNPEPDLTNKVASASALKSSTSHIGEIYELQTTGNINIPNAQHIVIYKGILPEGVYILSAKIFINIDNAHLICQNLRVQNVPSVYYTLSGLIKSDGINEIQISFYQSSGNTISRPYDYDYVRLVRLR